MFCYFDQILYYNIWTFYQKNNKMKNWTKEIKIESYISV